MTTWFRGGGIAVGLLALVLLTLHVNYPDLRLNPFIESLRWPLLGAWIGLVLWAGWRLSRPVMTRLRWLLLTVLILLLAGILMPPDVLQLLKDGLMALLPSLVVEEGPDTEILGHFSLFAVLAVLLFWSRADLGWLWLLGLLAALAGVTELMQFFVDGREPSWQDALVDLAGAGSGMLLAGALRWQRGTST